MKPDVRTPAGKQILIIAGPNGAGKTTFAKEFLPNEAGCPVFINADLIAAGLSPFAPDLAAVKAGRLMLEAIAEHEAEGESFAFETTLSGRIYTRRIPRWQAARYYVRLIYLALPSPEMAIARVKERVRQGGHDVPETAIRRRFTAGLRNFQAVYRDMVDAWSYYDNSGEKPVLKDWGEKL
jgi:predicted ABC-type ATPase